MQSIVHDSFETLLIAIGLSLPIGVWIIAIIRWMIDGSLEFVHGLIGIGVALALATLILWSPSQELRALVFVAVLSSLAIVPFAYAQLMKRESRLFDVDQLERAHEAFATNPHNASARFEVARVLYAFGLSGHAIAIADEASRDLPDEKDPVSNRSIRDMFHKELRMLAAWKSGADASTFRSVECPRCKAKNPPGAVACVRCGGPYLLDLARAQHVRSRFAGRLVMAWVLTSLVFAAVPFLAHKYGLSVAAIGIAAGIVLLGLAFSRMFADRPIA